MKARRAALACCAVIVLAATLTGCVPTATLGARTVRPDSITVDSDTTPRRIAPGLTATGTVESDRAPVAADGVIVSLKFPDSERGRLSFIGATSAGTLWQIDTNPSCVGTALTRAGDEELIVVLDSDARIDGGRVATRTVATAFRTDTGGHVWGPVEVPGPIQGPGLIFSDTPKAIVSADPVARVMLSAHDGSVVVDETASDVQIDYESNGVGLVRMAGELRAMDTRTSRTLWDSVSLARPDGTDSTWSASVDSTADTSRGTVVILRWAAPDGGQVVAAHNLRTGRLLGSLPGALEAHTVSSPSGSHIVVASTPAPGATILTAIDPLEGTLWTRSMTGTVTLEAASDATLYVRNDAQGVALNLASGVERARGDFAVPLAVLADGTAILPTGNPSRYLLAAPTPKDGP